jgi:hypothetical protein
VQPCIYRKSLTILNQVKEPFLICQSARNPECCTCKYSWHPNSAWWYHCLFSNVNQGGEWFWICVCCFCSSKSEEYTIPVCAATWNFTLGPAPQPAQVRNKFCSSAGIPESRLWFRNMSAILWDSRRGQTGCANM